MGNRPCPCCPCSHLCPFVLYCTGITVTACTRFFASVRSSSRSARDLGTSRPTLLHSPSISPLLFIFAVPRTRAFQGCKSKDHSTDFRPLQAWVYGIDAP
jgi:hypothetical protein